MISQTKETRRFCFEPLSHIENYDKAVADTEHVWDCHHRGEILPCGRFTRAQLQKYGLYWKRPASELVFLRRDVHSRLHHKGNVLSEETKRKVAESLKGRRHTEEAKHNMSAACPQKKKVEMTRLSDGYTREFPSMIESTRWLRDNGFPKAAHSAIHACCNGRRHYAYGAKWRCANGSAKAD